MKIIQITIIALSLLYVNIKGSAQTEKDTVKISFKGKNYKIDTKIDPDEEEKNRTLKFVDTVKKTMVLITVSTRAFDGAEWNTEKEDTDDDSITSAKLKKIVNLMNSHSNKKRSFIETSYLPTLDLGFVTTMNEMENPNAFNPKMGKSANINLGIIRQDMNLYKGRFLLSYGFNLNNYYLKYENKQMLQFVDQQGLLRSRIDSVNHNKNRQDVRYLTVPVMLEYHSKNGNFGIAAGVEFGFNGHTKVTLKGMGESDDKKKYENDIKINPEQMNAVVRLNLYDLEIFARYSITDMYRPSAYATQDANPHQHLLSFGLCLFGI